MKKMINKEVAFCDGCGKEREYGPICFICKDEFCYDCSKTHGTKLSEGIHHSGGKDLFICKTCEAKILSATTVQKNAYYAYLHLQKLRCDYNSFYEQFNKLQDEAESNAKSAYEALAAGEKSGRH